MKQKKPNAPDAIHCKATGCKKTQARFEFCPTHYDQFKFGLIKKDGEPAADYAKKLSHYEAYQEKQNAPKKAA